MKSLEKIEVRLEGEVNAFWDFIYTDGTVDSYYAFEGSAQESTSDRYVYDIDPKLYLLLNIILDKCHIPSEDETIEITFDSNLVLLSETLSSN